MTANFFHPVYRGKKLNESQMKDTNDYIFESLDGQALKSVHLFTANEGTFGTLIRKKINSPKTFWHFASQQGHKQLADFATKFLNIPASTAQLERLFSNWGYVHSDIRNRLKPETSKKLTNIYFTLRATEDPIDESDEDEE